MKGLFVLLIVVLPFCSVNAAEKQNTSEKKIVQIETSAYNYFATVQLSVNEIVLPLTIKVPAPSETVIGINGPCMPNITNWKVEGGYLTITYTKSPQILDLVDTGTFNIEVVTNPLKYYAIKLIVTE